MSSRSRDTAALAVGSAVAGLLAYAVFALSTRALGAAEAAPVSVLWSYWAFAGAAFTFPLQHWIARSVTAHGDGSVRRALPRLALVIGVASLVLGALAWLARDPLFHRTDLWFPLMVALVTVGSALIGVVRGGLSARGRFAAVGWSLVSENAVRCVAVGALAVAGVEDPVGYGLCLVAGHLVVVLWPSALRFDTARTDDVAVNPARFLAGTGLGQLVSQSVLTGGPVVLALAGGSKTEVTALFAALALFRAPYMLALGLVSQVTTRVTQLVIDGRVATLRRISTGLAGATVILAGLAAVVGGWIGPELLRLVFGDVHIDSGPAALVAVGCTLAVANLVLMVTAIAHDRTTAVARSWVLATVVGAITFAALAGLTAPERTVWSFLAAEVAAFVTLWAVEARGLRVSARA